jgi:hypothetical protein
MSKTVTIHIGPSARWARVGDLVASLKPVIEQRMRDAVNEALESTVHDFDPELAQMHREVTGINPSTYSTGLYKWAVRAKAAGMSPADIRAAMQRYWQSGDDAAMSLVIDGTAKGVGDEQ